MAFENQSNTIFAIMSFSVLKINNKISFVRFSEGNKFSIITNFCYNPSNLNTYIFKRKYRIKEDIDRRNSNLLGID